MPKVMINGQCCDTAADPTCGMGPQSNCTFPYVFDATKGTCVCAPGENCSTACVKPSSCPTGTEWNQDKCSCECLEGLWDGEKCVTNDPSEEDCTGGKVWSEENGRCECPAGTVEEDGVCVPEEEEGEQCPEGQFLWNGACVTKPECQSYETYNKVLNICELPTIELNGENCFNSLACVNHPGTWSKDANGNYSDSFGNGIYSGSPVGFMMQFLNRPMEEAPYLRDLLGFGTRENFIAYENEVRAAAESIVEYVEQNNIFANGAYYAKEFDKALEKIINDRIKGINAQRKSDSEVEWQQAKDKQSSATEK